MKKVCIVCSKVLTIMTGVGIKGVMSRKCLDTNLKQNYIGCKDVDRIAEVSIIIKVIIIIKLKQ